MIFQSIVMLATIRSEHFMLLLLILVTSCSSTEKEKPLPEGSTAASNPKFDNKRIPEDILAVGDQDADSVDVEIEGNLYGKFFCDRAEFYVVHNPKNRIQYSGVKVLTMCYLDGKLSQTKYILEKDITTQLLRAFGNFKIGGRDPKNQQLIESGKILVRVKDGYRLNDALDNFEIKWTVGKMLITYRKNIHDDQHRFVYVERVKDYEEEFKTIERYCI